MRIIILNASPRKKGNISEMVSVMADEARQNGADIDIIDANSLSIRPCIACMKCRSAHKCVMPDDDAQRVLSMMEAADRLVIASPCYWGNIPGTLKILFDRIVYGMMDENRYGMPIPLHKGKRAAVVSTSTTPWPFNIFMHQTRGVVRALREILHYSGFKIVATVEKGGTKHNTSLSAREEKKCRKAMRRLCR
ncbi:MAG: flavodoxin family protein [Prevotella sp.]